MTEHLEITATLCQARAGASIHACIREAVKLAANEEREVRFTHNGRTWRVALDRLAEACQQVDGPPYETRA